ncbi:MAG: hypothetical protein OXG88_09030 [Gammaproteobacteria bacterium]|nr:hypothetical protein [Gammaproteobacteria bacterium]
MADLLVFRLIIGNNLKTEDQEFREFAHPFDPESLYSDLRA